MCDGPRRTRWDGSRDAGSEHEYGRAPGEIQTDDRTHSFQAYTRPPVATVESADHRSRRRAAPRRAAIPPPRGPHLPVCASMCVPCKLVIGVRVRRRSGGLESGASKFCLVAVLVMLLSAASASVWWRRIEAGTLRLGSEPQLESQEASTCGVATWCISHGASIGWRGFGRPVAPPPPLLSSRLERLATLHFFSSAAAFLANLLEGLSRGAIRGAITLTAARPHHKAPPQPPCAYANASQKPLGRAVSVAVVGVFLVVLSGLLLTSSPWMGGLACFRRAAIPVGGWMVFLLF